MLDVQFLRGLQKAFKDEMKKVFVNKGLYAEIDGIKNDFIEGLTKDCLKTIDVKIRYGRCFSKESKQYLNFDRTATLLDIPLDATYDYFRGVAHIVIAAQDDPELLKN